MVDPTPGNTSIETRADLGTGDAALYSYWTGQEAIADREEKRWIKRAREVVKRYRDERPEATTNVHRYNILWSNVQTLKPSLYGKTPKPEVKRRFLDQDDTGRLAAELLERALAYALDTQDFDTLMKAVVEDRLLPGRGTARVMYIPHYGDVITAEGDNEEYEETEDAPSIIDNEGDEEANAEPETAQSDSGAPAAEPLREVVYEEAVCNYVFWEDYREGPARQWKEVPWIRYAAYMNRDELIARFGKKLGKQVNLDYIPKGGTPLAKEDIPADMHKKAKVHEYWDKVKMRVVWLAPGTPDVILDQVDDPLKLADFYPSPDPLSATMTNDKRIPVPDYIEYQDQARELDTLTARIDKLQRALKVSGIYPGENKQVLQQLIDEGTENRLIPVEDWPAWSEKGGLQNFIQWMPIEQIATTLIQLYDARDKVKSTLYEITGIGDIMRGNTQSNETATAQQLKTNFITRRVQPQQKDVANFARDIIRLMGGIIAEHFQPKTISMITGYPHLKPVPQPPPQPQMPPQLQQFLMMAQQAQAQQGNVVPIRPGLPVPGQPAAPPAPSAPGGPGVPSAPAAGGAPQPQIPPQIQQMAQQFQAQMQQWQQAMQQLQAIQAANQQEQQKFDAAVALIKSDGIHGFRLDIEADSTIAADEQEEKANRIEFLRDMVPLIQQVGPLAMGNPPMAAIMKEVTLFAVRGFRVGRSLEETFEKAFDQLAQMPPSPNGPLGQKGKQGSQENPQLEAAKLEAQTHDTDTNAKIEMAKLAAHAQETQMTLESRASQAAKDDQQQDARIALDAAELTQRERLENARLEHIQATSAKGLK